MFYIRGAIQMETAEKASMTKECFDKTLNLLGINIVPGNSSEVNACNIQTECPSAANLTGPPNLATPLRRSMGMVGDQNMSFYSFIFNIFAKVTSIPHACDLLYIPFNPPQFV